MNDNESGVMITDTFSVMLGQTRTKMTIYTTIPEFKKLENVFMKHYAPNHMLVSREGSSNNACTFVP